MEVILMFLVFFILYCGYAFRVIKRSFVKNHEEHDNIKRPFGRYFLAVAFFLISYILLSAFCMLIAWIIGDGLLELKGNKDYIPFISLVLAVLLLTIGLFPVKAVYCLLYRRPLRIFAKEIFTPEAKFFSWQGRIGRLRYFGGLMTIYIGMPVAGVLFIAVLMQLPLTDGAREIILMITVILMAVIMIGLNVIFVVKRIHDLDKSRTHAWLLLMPLYNIYLGLLLLYEKGSFGDNRFGPDPVEPPSMINELCNSFKSIDINKNQYIVAYSYNSREMAAEEYERLKKTVIDYKEKIDIQLREYSTGGADEAQIVLFAENPLKFDSLISWLGNGDYAEGKKRISTGTQKEYFGRKGYRELLGNSQTVG